MHKNKAKWDDINTGLQIWTKKEYNDALKTN